jgi:predicted XRE-type DNA-binding protein
MLSDGDPVPGLKRQLAAEIRALVGHVSPDVAAHVFGMYQPRMWNIFHDRLHEVSLQKLVRMLAHIDRRVTMKVVNEGSPVVRIFQFKNPRPGYRDAFSRPSRGTADVRAPDPSRDSR